MDDGFLFDEWTLIVDARNIHDGGVYRELPRHGRRTRLMGDRRGELWRVFVAARVALGNRSKKTYARVVHDVADALPTSPQPPFDHVVVDEAQDISIGELRLAKSFCGSIQNPSRHHAPEPCVQAAGSKAAARTVEALESAVAAAWMPYPGRMRELLHELRLRASLMRKCSKC